MQNFRYSDAGFSLTKTFEGLRLAAYQDEGGVWTIGYGHTGMDVAVGRSVTTLEAEVLLRTDLRFAVDCVNRAVTAPMEQFHFDALVDFCFNAGSGSFVRSDLLRYVNEKDYAAAAAQFAQWVHVDQRVIPGLVRRRAAEAAMFRGEALPR